MAKTSRNRRKRGNNSDYKKLPKLWKQIYEFIRQTKGVTFDWIPLARKKKLGRARRLRYGRVEEIERCRG